MIKQDGIKLDKFIEFHYKDFYFAVKNWKRHFKWAYFSIIIEYWDKDCAGFKKAYVDLLLKSVGELEENELEEGRQLIFGQEGFFQLERNLWHQEFARNLFQEKINKSKKWREQTKAANEANAIKHAQKNYK